MKSIATGTLALIICALLSSCAAMYAKYQKDYCNYDSAFEKGLEDAQKKRLLNENFSYPCMEEQRADAEKGYREGYAAATTITTETETAAAPPKTETSPPANP